MVIDPTFWRGRKVFLTGHTGFKGAWASLLLGRLGAEVYGFALAPENEADIFQTAEVGRDVHHGLGDVRDLSAISAALAQARPDIVIHMAAQSLVRLSYAEPVTTYATNVMGTVNLLEAVRHTPGVQAVVVVTSDKCYENRGWTQGYRETDRLGGHDPYSNSKACAELVTASFRDSFFAAGPAIATARAGNVIGGGDWSEDRLIPDCVRALKTGQSVNLRYPDAVRPWQHVLEPLSGYLAVAEALVTEPKKTPRAVNFGPDPASFCTVREVVDAFGARFQGKPGWIRDPAPRPPEAQALTLSSELAGHALGWHPRLDIRESLSWTADWYSAHSAGEHMAAFTEAQIARYRELLKRSP